MCVVEHMSGFCKVTHMNESSDGNNGIMHGIIIGIKYSCTVSDVAWLPKHVLIVTFQRMVTYVVKLVFTSVIKLTLD